MEVGSLPICNGKRLVDYVTESDIALRGVAEGRDPSALVSDCMTPEVRWCFEDDSLEEAQRMMKEHQIRRLPVVSRDRRLVGILSLGDLAIKTDSSEQAGETLQEISDWLRLELLKTVCTAKDRRLHFPT